MNETEKFNADLAQLLKELKKSAQKSDVQAIGSACIRNQDTQQIEFELKEKEQVNEVKDSISRTSDQLDSAIKGQFSKQIKSAFKNGKNELESLL